MISEVTICCWTCGYEQKSNMTLRDEHKLEQKIAKSRAVCPECRDKRGVNNKIFIKAGRTVVNAGKVLRCQSGHINLAYVLGDNIVCLKHDDKINNYEISFQDFDVTKVSCQNCEETLVEVDTLPLEKPSMTSIKTKTRVGDIWDRNRMEPVRPGAYDKDYNFKESQTSKSNKERLKKIRKTRNVSTDNMPKTIAVNEITKTRRPPQR